jgi:hypothetical protein
MLAPEAQVAARVPGSRSAPPAGKSTLDENRVREETIHCRTKFYLLSNPELAYLENQLELDGHVEGKLGGAEGEPSMAAGLAEDLH